MLESASVASLLYFLLFFAVPVFRSSSIYYRKKKGYLEKREKTLIVLSSDALKTTYCHRQLHSASRMSPTTNEEL